MCIKKHTVSYIAQAQAIQLHTVYKFCCQHLRCQNIYQKSDNEKSTVKTGFFFGAAAASAYDLIFSFNADLRLWVFGCKDILAYNVHSRYSLHGNSLRLLCGQLYCNKLLQF